MPPQDAILPERCTRVHPEQIFMSRRACGWKLVARNAGKFRHTDRILVFPRAIRGRLANEPPGVQTTLGPGHWRNTANAAACCRFYVWFAGCSLPSQKLARSDGAVCGIELHYRRALGLPADSGPHDVAALGGASPGTTGCPVQDQDGCRRDGPVSPADCVHVYRQLFAHQPKPVVVVSQTTRNRLRRNAKALERSRPNTVAPASRTGFASAVGKTTLRRRLPATRVRKRRGCGLDSRSSWKCNSRRSGLRESAGGPPGRHLCRVESAGQILAIVAERHRSLAGRG